MHIVALPVHIITTTSIKLIYAVTTASFVSSNEALTLKALIQLETTRETHALHHRDCSFLLLPFAYTLPLFSLHTIRLMSI